TDRHSNSCPCKYLGSRCRQEDFREAVKLRKMERGHNFAHGGVNGSDPFDRVQHDGPCGSQCDQKDLHGFSWPEEGQCNRQQCCTRDSAECFRQRAECSFGSRQKTKECYQANADNQSNEESDGQTQKAWQQVGNYSACHEPDLPGSGQDVLQ